MKRLHRSMPQPCSPRAAAIATLRRFWHSPAPIRDFFADKLSALDRRLAMNIVYGVLRQRQFLEALIVRLCHHPLHKLDATLREALAAGLYQLFFLSRIPTSAAVNETVEAAKQLGLPPHLTGVLNGSLRGAIRQKDDLPRADGFLNHPDWLINRWQERFGQAEMRRLCAANNGQPPLTARVNIRRRSQAEWQTMLAANGITARPGAYAPDALILPDYQGAISALPGFTEGFFHVQDEAAQLACLLLGKSDEKIAILDACAGLGGKTATIAQLFPKAAIIAVEPDAERGRLFAENRRRLDCAAELFTDTLAAYAATQPPLFHGIFLDAPCSGSGVCGRRPEIRWSRHVAELPRFHDKQLALLNCAATLLAPGGVLLYATCSLEDEENGQVIGDFLAEHPDMIPEDCRPFLPEAASAFLTADGFFQALPSQNLDGFFAARLRKR
ncbi:MAG: 16S rRNA (cytosine(967)-C(5))-methyltransferase RsmB [Desulfobulbaceae bacterium]|nr:16S rRNA (cytosine(967)-C(5))-methyltransferase RsmB [Desulfobulbaceae bacterium]